MVFSSVFFIWIFLPIVLLVYYGAYLFCRKNPENQIKADNIILLLASLTLFELGGIDPTGYPSYYEYTVHYKENIKTTYETEGLPYFCNIYKTEANCGNNTRFVLIGDSYRNYMVEYIKRDFDHCTFVHREHVSEAIDDILAADVLVLESVERYDYKSLIDADYLIQLLSSQP